MKRYSTLCVKVDGKPKVEDRAGFDRFWANVDEGAEMELTWKDTTRAKLRTLKALGYYWGVVLAIAEKETGQPADDIHAWMVDKFVPSEEKRLEFVNKLTGEHHEIDIEQRHSPKDGGPFFDFVELVRQELRELLNIDTPDPDPEWWRHSGRARKRAA